MSGFDLPTDASPLSLSLMGMRRAGWQCTAAEGLLFMLSLELL